MDSDRSDIIIRKNGTLEDRIEKIRESRRPQAVVEKVDKGAEYLHVKPEYTKQRKQFKNRNLEKAKFTEVLYKQALQKKQFYPYVLREPEKVSLKDDKPNIEMKKGRINVNEVVLSRNGEESFPISKFFNTYAFVECSMQFFKDPLVVPEWDFFAFDAQKGRAKEMNELFKESGDQLGNEANQVRKAFKKIHSKLNFIDVVHILVSDILPASSYPEQQYVQNFEDPTLSIMMFEPYTERLIQCNDERDGWSVCPPSIYFKNMNTYHQYKKKQEISTKRLNIYSKQVEVFSDIRYILHPEKTYFIQIMEEVKQAIETANDIQSDEEFDIQILEQIYELIYVKSQEFLLLICTYIPSSIDLQIRTNKLSEYFWSNFMYMDEIHQVNPELLSKYNVLSSWHSMPKRMFGYRKEEIQTRFYNLIKAGCRIQRRLNFKKKLNDLTVSNQQKIEVENFKKQQKNKLKSNMLALKDKSSKTDSI